MNKCENVKMLPIAKPSSNWHWALVLATLATLATFASGCVIGHAKFEGEDMHLYPFWQTNAETSSVPASAEVE